MFLLLHCSHSTRLFDKTIIPLCYISFSVLVYSSTASESSLSCYSNVPWFHYFCLSFKPITGFYSMFYSIIYFYYSIMLLPEPAIVLFYYPILLLCDLIRVFFYFIIRSSNHYITLFFYYSSTFIFLLLFYMFTLFFYSVIMVPLLLSVILSHYRIISYSMILFDQFSLSFYYSTPRACHCITP